nr:MAG TPA: hypothetical protein [Caudoviricetes sp.]
MGGARIMDVIEMNKLEDILSAIEYNGGGA